VGTKYFLFGMFSIVFALIGIKVSLGQSATTTGFTQPKPYIINPVNNTTVSGNATIMVYINPTVVQEMDIYALNSASNRLFLGIASQVQGTYFSLNLNTSSLANGPYRIWAEAHIGDGQIVTYSDKIIINVQNTSTNTTNNATTTPVPTKVITPTPAQSTPTPSATENTSPIPTPAATQSTPKSSSSATPTPQATLPVPKNTPTPIQSSNLTTGSILLKSVKFDLFKDKANRLEKIEGRKSSQGQEFLIFSGVSLKDTFVKLTIESQPIVVSVQSNSNGDWTYTLEKPLEPGSHEAFVEVNNGQVAETTGPYPFTIAKAQATADNPAGSSLSLTNSTTYAIKNYLYIIAGIIGIAILAVIFFYYRKSKKVTN